jgi:hypothetical protein
MCQKTLNRPERLDCWGRRKKIDMTYIRYRIIWSVLKTYITATTLSQNGIIPPNYTRKKRHVRAAYVTRWKQSASLAYMQLHALQRHHPSSGFSATTTIMCFPHAETRQVHHAGCLSAALLFNSRFFSSLFLLGAKRSQTGVRHHDITCSRTRSLTWRPEWEREVKIIVLK